MLPVEFAEMGDYDEPAGRMQDWVLFRSKTPSELKGMPIAQFPTSDEMSKLLSQQAQSLGDCGAPVWGIGFPSKGYRQHPRPPIPGSKTLFLSRGMLLSHDVFKLLNVLAEERGVVYDHHYSPPLPEPDVDLDAGWAKLAEARVCYEAYEKIGAKLLFHSTDFAGGQSGGGLFSEETGHILGIYPRGYGPVSPNHAYPGPGWTYRIDNICAESKVLSDHDGCARLMGESGAERAARRSVGRRAAGGDQLWRR